MAKPGLAQEQTVEEILASIRQVINGDQSRSASADTKPEVTPRRTAIPAGPSRPGSTITSLHGIGEKAPDDRPEVDDAAGEDAPSARASSAPEPTRQGDSVPMQDVIELAIEEALGGLSADGKRAEPGKPAAEARSPFRPPFKPPRVDPRPSVREALRPEPRPPAHEPSRAESSRETARPEPHSTAREASHVEPQPADREPLRGEPLSSSREPPRPSTPAPRPLPPPPSPSRSLLSPRANAAVAASFDDLARVLASRGAREIDQHRGRSPEADAEELARGQPAAPWSSGWSARRSSGYRAAAAEGGCRGPAEARFARGD